MSRYSIEGSTLTAIGDAVRGRVGEIKEGLVPIEPYTHSFNQATDNMSDWVTSILWAERKTYFPLINGASQYKVAYSFTPGVDNGLDSVNLYFRSSTGAVRGNVFELVAGENIEGIWDASNIGDAVNIEVFESIYSAAVSRKDMVVDLTIYPIDADGNIIENEIKYVFNSMTPIGMAEAINNMSPTPPDAAFKISGNCIYKFYGGGWDWFIKLYGDKITTENISSLSNTFNASNLEYIPFDLNLVNTSMSFNNAFYGCTKLKELPRIVAKTGIPIPTSKYSFSDIGGMFSGCQSLKEIPEEYYDTIFVDGYMEAKETYQVDGESGAFNGCYSLRSIPYKIYFAQKSYGTAYYNSMYYNLHSNNYVLDEIVNLPVEPGPYTSNCFSGMVSNCHRLKRFTFETNEDSTPKTANWKGQTIFMGGVTTDVVGYAYSTSHKNNILKYNSGITADKEVKDEATYAALKNDSDWFCVGESYSRYNKTSALETIATLPDCSASGGTNTIRFRGVAGGKTDGGAINTMTEEEIAVAIAKGWTVTLV